MELVDNQEWLTTEEVKDRLNLKTNAALCEITVKFEQYEVNKHPNLVEKLIGDQLIGIYALNHRLKYPLEYVLAYLQKEKSKRDLSKDIDLITESKETIDILGINSLGPLHSGMEEIIKLNNRGGNVNILLLNPWSTAFINRERDEELHNDIITSRLRAEYIASFGIIEHIQHHSINKRKIKIKFHKTYPKMALVISDRNRENAVLNCNIYPLEKGSRGFMGRHKFRISKKEKPKIFTEYCNYYDELWNTEQEFDQAKLQSILNEVKSFFN